MEKYHISFSTYSWSKVDSYITKNAAQPDRWMNDFMYMILNMSKTRLERKISLYSVQDRTGRFEKLFEISE